MDAGEDGEVRGFPSGWAVSLSVGTCPACYRLGLYTLPGSVGQKTGAAGHPERKHISTSYVKRSNLSMRMGMRRLSWLNSAFSKKLDNHFHALSPYSRSTISHAFTKCLESRPVAAGVTDRLWSWKILSPRMDAAERPKKGGPYRKADAPALTQVTPDAQHSDEEENSNWGTTVLS
jgi:hypothetical protein